MRHPHPWSCLPPLCHNEYSYWPHRCWWHLHHHCHPQTHHHRPCPCPCPCHLHPHHLCPCRLCPHHPRSRPPHLCCPLPRLFRGCVLSAGGCLVRDWAQCGGHGSVGVAQVWEGAWWRFGGVGGVQWRCGHGRASVRHWGYVSVKAER